MKGRRFATMYMLSEEGLRLPIDGVPTRASLYVKWVDLRPDSVEVRADILAQVARRVGVDKLPRKVELQLTGVVPAEFAPETEIHVDKAMPNPRARVLAVYREYRAEDFDLCVRFEDGLAKLLGGTEIGFVDGNDIGGGECRVFCFGPRKAPLLEAVRGYVERAGDPRWCVK